MILLQYVKQIFTSCNDLLQRKQFCYILARHVSDMLSVLFSQNILHQLFNLVGGEGGRGGWILLYFFLFFFLDRNIPSLFSFISCRGHCNCCFIIFYLAVSSSVVSSMVYSLPSNGIGSPASWEMKG